METETRLLTFLKKRGSRKTDFGHRFEKKLNKSHHNQLTQDGQKEWGISQEVKRKYTHTQETLKNKGEPYSFIFLVIQISSVIVS